MYYQINQVLIQDMILHYLVCVAYVISVLNLTLNW